MAYTSGILRNLIGIWNRTETDGSTAWGEKTEFKEVGCVHAAVDWTRGTKALHEGALEGYDVVLFRMRWNSFTTRDSQIEYDGRRYQILSFHADRKENTIQITAQEITV